MTEVQRADRRSWVTFGLAVVGLAVLMGSAVGAAYGIARDVVGSLGCVCAYDE